MCVFLCLCVFEPAVYDYLFPMQSKRLQLWWKCVYRAFRTVLCAPRTYSGCALYASLLAAFGGGLLMKSIFAWTRPAWRMSRQRFHNICFEPDETWYVNYRRLDEPWVPPGFNCPHHQSDCKLTDSAGHQLVKCLQRSRRSGRDDGIIRYLCFLLCLVQQGVAHSTGSWYSVCH